MEKGKQDWQEVASFRGIVAGLELDLELQEQNKKRPRGNFANKVTAQPAPPPPSR
jgi:hypothetical protein